MNDVAHAHDPLAEATALAEAQRHQEALAVLEPWGHARPASGAFELARVRSLLALEQYAAAFQEVNALLEQPLGELERAQASYWRGRLLRRASPLVDEAIELCLGAAQTGERLAAVRGPSDEDDAWRLAVEARCEAALLFCRKRCRGLAERELAHALRLDPDDPRVTVTRGWVAVEFDERPEALVHFAAAKGLGPTGVRLGALGTAHVHILLGDFDEAAAELDALGPAPDGDLMLRRVRIALHEARSQWAEVAALHDEIATLSPAGDHARASRLEAASARYRIGDVSGALAGWRLAAEGAPEHDRLAAMAARLSRLVGDPAADGKPRRRLVTFPSVAQLRDHCGPASCELYLRFFGIGAEQLEIARAIKFPHGGTPVYKMRRFLDEAGLASRRVEADLPHLKALIDAGIPVIMEEDYSDTRHVAVAIGYDDRREVLEVQDPMTHDVRETFYEDLPRIRNMSNHGALIGVPREDAVRLAELDAIGAVEARYIALVDEAWAAYDDNRGADGDVLVDQAIEMAPGYELAWMYRFRRAREPFWNGGATPEHMQALERLVAEIQRRWPDDEWPQQLAGEVHYAAGRWQEALVAFETARDRDPGDAHNWSTVADCLIELGRDDDAYHALAQALERNPAHVRGNENLAHMCLRRGQIARAWILNDAARELHPENAFNHIVHAKLLARRGDLTSALAAYDRALAVDASRRDALIERPKIMARLGRIDEGAATLRQAIAARPEDVGLRIELADLLYAHGRFAEAAAAAEELTAAAPEHPSGHAILGAARAQLGELDAGFAELDRALALLPTYAWVHAQRGRALGAAGRHQEAIVAHAAAAGLSRQHPDRVADLGEALVAAGYPEKAHDYLHDAALAGDFDETRLVRIGELLVDSRHHVHTLFQEIARRRPGDPGVLRAHAHLLLEVLWAPDAVRPVIEQLAELVPGDAYVKAFRGADLMDGSLAGEEPGEELLRQAIAAAPGRLAPRRMLGQRLVDLGRFPEALAVLADAGDAYTTAQLRVRALLGDGRPDEVEREIADFTLRHQTGVGEQMLRYRLARWRGDWRGALELAEVITHAQHEREDDNRLDSWETEKFQCLVRLGESERALHFGERQAVDADSLASLAWEAIALESHAVAGELAQRALHLDPDQTTALHVMARVAEVGGHVEQALATWDRIAELDDDWHVPHEHTARVLLGVGDADDALAEAEQAVDEGHLCAWAFSALAQAQLITGDLEDARASLERAWRLLSPESRQAGAEDITGLRALLAGDHAAAERAFATYLRADAPISAADRARVARCREAVG